MSIKLSALSEADDEGEFAVGGAIAVGWEYLPLVFALIEVAAIVGAGVIGALAFGVPFLSASESASWHPLIVALAAGGVYGGVARLFGTYDEVRLMDRLGALGRSLSAWLVALLFLCACAVVTGGLAAIGLAQVAALLAAGAVAIIAVRLGLNTSVGFRFWASILRPRGLVVVGDRDPFEALGADGLERHGRKILGRFILRSAEGEPSEHRAELSRAIADVVSVARARRVEEIVLAFPWTDRERIASALSDLKVLPLSVYLIPEHGHGAALWDGAGDGQSRGASSFWPSCAIEAHRGPLDPDQALLKRAFDIAVSGAGLVLLSPVLALIGLMVKLDSDGPVLFKQTRIGYAGRPFKINKFRTMHTLEDGHLVQQATQGDARVTFTGRFLRASSLDELPQLINVLIGDMSLVGPRPHAVAHDNEYGPLIPKYALRHHVKPGITGWAQVNGQRGATPTVDLMAKRVEFDLAYIAGWSLRFDLHILVRTVVEVLRCRNAY